MNQFGWAGLIVFSLALAVIVAEILYVLVALRRLRKRLLALEGVWGEEGARLEVELQRLDQIAARRRILLRPYVRLRKRLRHPLLVVAVQSYRRRRRK